MFLVEFKVRAIREGKGAEQPRSQTVRPRGGLRAVLDWLRGWSLKAGSVFFRTTGSESHLKLTADIKVLLLLAVTQRRQERGGAKGEAEEFKDPSRPNWWPHLPLW